MSPASLSNASASVIVQNRKSPTSSNTTSFDVCLFSVANNALFVQKKLRSRLDVAAADGPLFLSMSLISCSGCDWWAIGRQADALIS